MNSTFKPNPWLRSPHLQTLWPRFVSTQQLDLETERLELEDGDFIDLAWSQNPGPHQPIVLLFHGLEGCAESPYIQGMLAAILQQGWCGCVMHFRSCSSEINRLSRSYHSGESGDIKTIIQLMSERYPSHPLFAIGYSLGGNALLKYLGENREPKLAMACAVSVPFQLNRGADRLQQGFSRFYQWYLLSKLKKKMVKKFSKLDSVIDPNSIRQHHNFWQFDHHVTAPVHGFTSAKDYYLRCSSRQFLSSITVPTHIIHALDDPFLPLDAIPDDHELAPDVTLELPPYGGHVGFLGGSNPLKPVFWLEQRIPEIIHAHLENKD